MKHVKVVAIVSGGMDSVVMAHMLSELYDLDILAFNYGQRHKKELEYSRACAEQLGARWDLVPMPNLGKMLSDSSSTLVDLSTEVPEGHYAEDNMRQTVVPNRNAIMLSIATGIAIARGASMVATAVHAGDHFIYPDCRLPFIEDLTEAFRKGNEGFIDSNFLIYAPFINSSKADIAIMGHSLGVDFRKTWSCYKGGEVHCGKCGTCVERQEALHLAGVVDLTAYEDSEYWKGVTSA